MFNQKKTIWIGVPINVCTLLIQIKQANKRNTHDEKKNLHNSTIFHSQEFIHMDEKKNIYFCSLIDSFLFRLSMIVANIRAHSFKTNIFVYNMLHNILAILSLFLYLPY